MLVRNYIFLISFLFISFAQAAIETQKLQILAAKVTTNNDTLIATGDVVRWGQQSPEEPSPLRGKMGGGPRA